MRPDSIEPGFSAHGVAARLMRALAGIGALGCGVAVGMGAYAMHAASTSQNHERLAIAALFLFAHGLALASLAPRTTLRLRQVGLCVVMIGTILFSGSLALAATLDIAPSLAPFGGGLLMLGWLLVAAGFLFE
jgi:uncharacterized membrane protein YgdD (TMEM256/DUF423 family)